MRKEDRIIRERESQQHHEHSNPDTSNPRPGEHEKGSANVDQSKKPPRQPGEMPTQK